MIIHGVDTSKKFDILEASVTQRLDFLWVELTNACNLQCGHCYAKSGPHGGADDRVPAGTYFEVIAAARQLGCRKIQFIGGEATLHSDLSTMVESCRDLGYQHIEVFTNLISLSDGMLDAFVVNDVAIATSFYAANPDIHDEITGRRGSWTRTVRNLKRVLAAGLSCRAGIILMDQNRDELAATEAYLQALGVTNIGRDEVRSFGRAAESEAAEDMSSLCGSCAGDVVCVGYDGRVSPCIMSKKWSVGDLGTQSFADILSSRKLAQTREAIHDAVTARIAEVGEATMGSCNPDCQPCSPKSNDTCTPKTMCYPQHTPNCSPKF